MLGSPGFGESFPGSICLCLPPGGFALHFPLQLKRWGSHIKVSESISSWFFFPEMRDRNLTPFFYRWLSNFPGAVCLRGFLSSNMCVVVWQRMVPHSPGHGEPWSPVATAVWRLSHMHAGKRTSWGKALRSCCHAFHLQPCCPCHYELLAFWNCKPE